jgi:Carboxypeptidase regulatory-like domain
MASRSTWLPVFYPSAVDPNEAESIDVRQGEGASFDIRMVRRQPLLVRGVVLSDTGIPVGGASVSAWRSNTQGSLSGTATTADATGAFRFTNLPPGEYIFAVRPWQMRRERSRSGEFGAVRVSLYENETSVVIPTTMRVALSGRILTDEPDRPISNAIKVQAVPADDLTVAATVYPPEAPVAENGGFTLHGVYGMTVLRVVGLSGSYIKAVTLGPSDITNTPTEFRSVTDPVTVVLSATGRRIQGTVKTSTGEPAGNIPVVVFSSAQSLWKGYATTTRKTVTKFNGEFIFEGLPNAEYYVAAIPASEYSNILTADEAYFSAVSKVASLARAVGSDPIQLSLIVSSLRNR